MASSLGSSKLSAGIFEACSFQGSCKPQRFFLQMRRRSFPNVRAASTDGALSGDSRSFSIDNSNGGLERGFSIIESPETIVDFAKMQLEEIGDNIRSRRNKIFLLMEEVRRLRIQQRLKGVELGLEAEEDEEPEVREYSSLFPFLPPLTSTTLRLYYATCFSLCGAIIFFGGVIAPALELKLGIGFTSYTDFIERMHLPIQLSQVDPIVASFSGGAVGVISSLMVVEANNIRLQDKQRCKYCVGTGYLPCARCSGTGLVKKAFEAPGLEKCPICFGVTKVMCPTCLCTGMALATEHDPRIDPFDLV